MDTGMMEHTEGSAQVDLGETRSTSKMKIGVVDMGQWIVTPNQGNLVCSAELLPPASPTYESGTSQVRMQ